MIGRYPLQFKNNAQNSYALCNHDIKVNVINKVNLKVYYCLTIFPEANYSCIASGRGELNIKVKISIS